jgi:hypothetical protein
LGGEDRNRWGLIVLAYDRQPLRLRHDQRRPVVRRWFDDCGRIRARVPLSRCGVFEYAGNTVPGWRRLGLDANKVYRVCRPASELRAATHTFASVPIYVDHIALDSGHRTDLAVGAVGADVKMIGDFLVADVVIWDRAAIAGIKSGKRRELSAGYAYSEPPKITPGVWRSEPYSLVMRNLTAHHIALVDEGKCGPEVGL